MESVVSFPKQSQGSVLRIYGNGEVFVEDICKYLSALEQAYNSAYVFDSIAEQANEIADFYGEQRPPIPLRNLLWSSWWPPNAEKLKGLVPDDERLKLLGVELQSPGFWDFLGKLNPLEVLRAYLNDRHERRKDIEYREEREARKLELENELLEIQVIEKKLELLEQMGATPQDLLLLRDKLLHRPLRGLNEYQDQQLIITAEIVDPEFEQPKLR